MCTWETKVEASILDMKNLIFPGVSQEHFKSVKKSYGEKVVKVMREVEEEHMEDVLILINHMLPELANTLASQRNDNDLDLAPSQPCN